jgi:putative hydrolase of the HAD superfamily
MLFDLDDTLLRYNLTPELAWKEACGVSAKETGLYKTEELLNLIDTISDWYWSDPEKHRAGRLNLHGARTSIVRMALARLGCDDERIATKVATVYSNLREESLGLFPDTEDVLWELVRKGVKLALLTNGAGDVQRVKIEKFRLAQYFYSCLIEGELGYGKPDQRVFEMALDKLAATPNQTWMVGDDLERDIAGAQKVGVFSIWHDYEKKGLPEDMEIKPDKIINNIPEIPSLY